MLTLKPLKQQNVTDTTDLSKYAKIKLKPFSSTIKPLVFLNREGHTIFEQYIWISGSYSNNVRGGPRVRKTISYNIRQKATQLNRYDRKLKGPKAKFYIDNTTKLYV